MATAFRYVAYLSGGTVHALVQDADGEKLRDLASVDGFRLGPGTDHDQVRGRLELAREILADHQFATCTAGARRAAEIYRLAELIERAEVIFQIDSHELDRLPSRATHPNPRRSANA